LQEVRVGGYLDGPSSKCVIAMPSDSPRGGRCNTQICEFFDKSQVVVRCVATQVRWKLKRRDNALSVAVELHARVRSGYRFWALSRSSE
jgi:hypothetical protein